MQIGYARVSIQDQTLNRELDALKLAGCRRVFTDTASGAKTNRKGLESAFDHLRAGDVLVVWRLDRLGRTLKQLIELINDLNAKGSGFRSLQENIDTTSSGGLIFHIFGALAEFEREVIRERTQAGLASARARGRLGGRPKAITDPKKLSLLYSLYDSREHSIKDILETLRLSRATLYKYLAQRKS
jgi:DNA invertase Pin-like site-specific DNA recombinase